MGKGIKRPAKPDKDFSKKRFKVGRKLAKPQNETKVDVRVRKLNLPGQTALDDVDEPEHDGQRNLKVRRALQPGDSTTISRPPDGSRRL